MGEPLKFKIGNARYIRANGSGHSGDLIEKTDSSSHSALGPDLVIVHSLPANRCQLAHAVQGADLITIEPPRKV